MKIICIGRNFEKHAKELGNPKPDEPIFFIKPDSALLRNNDPFYIPTFSKQIHYEVEVVVKICKVGKSIQEKFAPKYYNEIGLGIDFTARDIQLDLMKKGLPWEKAKAFDYSAAISKQFIPIKDIADIDNLPFSLKINNKVVQLGNTNEMIFKVNEIISHVSKYVTLKIGDLIYTGTPEGVDKVNIGDQLEGFIADKQMFNFDIK